MDASISTDFAALTASAASDDFEALFDSLSLHRVNPPIALPPSLSVDSTLGLVVLLRSKFATQNFSFTLRLDAVGKPGSPESGEGLDAQRWDVNGATLMLGTEDGELLRDRHAWYTPDLTSYYPVSYLPNGFSLFVHRVPPHAELSFHFVLAYSRHDRGDNAAWFAVDVAHDAMLESPVVCPIHFQCPS